VLVEPVGGLLYLVFEVGIPFGVELQLLKFAHRRREQGVQIVALEDCHCLLGFIQLLLQPIGTLVLDEARVETLDEPFQFLVVVEVVIKYQQEKAQILEQKRKDGGHEGLDQEVALEVESQGEL